MDMPPFRVANCLHLRLSPNNNTLPTSLTSLTVHTLLLLLLPRTALARYLLSRSNLNTIRLLPAATTPTRRPPTITTPPVFQA